MCLKKCLFDDALHFAEISGPGITLQSLHCFRGDLLNVAAEFAAEATEEVFEEHGEVFAALAQRGKVDGEDAEAVVEVGAERFLVGHGFEVAMSGGDEADVGADGLVSTDAFEGLFLEESEDFGLEGEGHVADFVEEDGAAIALLEFADAAAVGTGEGAFFVTEEFGFQEVFGDGGAVEGHEGCLGAGAVLVDSAGDEFLAGAGFSSDEDGDVLGGDATDGFVDFAHGGTGTEDGAVAVGLRGRLGDDGGGAHASADFEGFGNDESHLAEIERFEEVVEGAKLHRFDGGVGGRGAGDEDDGDTGVGFAELVVDVEPGLIGEAHVEQDDVGGMGAGAGEAFFSGVGDVDTVSGRGKRLADLLGYEAGVIVYEQQMSHGLVSLGAPEGVRVIERNRGTFYSPWRFIAKLSHEVVKECSLPRHLEKSAGNAAFNGRGRQCR